MGKSTTFEVRPFTRTLSCTFHTYEWNFGDGTAPVFAGSLVNHEYVAPGRYTVSVTINGVDTIQLDGSVLILSGPVDVLAPVPSLSPVFLLMLAMALAGIGVFTRR